MTRWMKAALAALLALPLSASAADRGLEAAAPVVSAPSMPAALDVHVQALTRLSQAPDFPASAAAYLGAALAAPSSPAAAAAARLAAEALARPELFSALPGSDALERQVAQAHAQPDGKQALLSALAPLRAKDDPSAPPDLRLAAWSAAFDGGRAGYAPLAANFPGMRYAYGDPAAIRAGGRYFVASTSNNAADAGPIVTSKDLRQWRLHGFLFPRERRPAWHDQDDERYDFWAPEIHKVGRRYVAYYTARDRSGALRIGAAYASSMNGPWTDLGRPLISDDRVGLIDSHQFRDPVSGKRYLYWKKDGNDLRPREKTTYYARELAPDGLSLVGPRHEVLENDQDWEADVVEGGWVVYRDGWYYMLYSGNDYTTERYALGVARSRSPLGPFEKSPRRLLSTGALARGPGHCSVVKGPRGEDLLVYHAYDPATLGYRADRVMRVEPLLWVDGWPRVGNGFPGGAPPLP